MTPGVATAEDFLRLFDVSRETSDRLLILHDLTLKWNRSVNLIARGTEPALWGRHIADSAQLWALRPPFFGHWVDIGAGAGFPGLVVAVLAAELDPGMRMTLVESDGRKSVFLAEAARAMRLSVRTLNARVETLEPLQADVLSARALAPLDRLLAHAHKHRVPGGIGLFLKGRTVHKEIAAADLKWRFERRLHCSLTEPGAAIVEVGTVSSV
ncbi:MAG: 16S rRNA (guanine(527)-N(7))-methyltransferase RsmG [Rhodobacteraceae bacterium]|nr:16S rRNA (guanine(527)-N(7))-methyltransferase RsmG [Paracoccaceae bacterium]